MQKKKLINLIENKFREEFYAVPIGTIFSFASVNPPPGAFILNGQIISNCQTLFPDFWNWLISESTNNNIRVVTSATFESELSSCGNCGAFVIDTAVGSVRLPSITTGFIQGTNSNIGNSESAGLPNITGKFALSSNLGSTYSPSTQSGAFYADSTVHTTLALAGGNTANGYKVAIDASRSSSIYGNSNTVQPPAAHYQFCIQVYNSTSKLSTANASQIISEMQSKAGINLDNITANGKNVISDTAFELDFNNKIDITSLNTIYKADRAGILYAYCVSSNSSGYVDLRCYFKADSGACYASITYILNTNRAEARTLIIPKNMYYSFNSANTSTSLASFIPFKNSN